MPKKSDTIKYNIDQESPVGATVKANPGSGANKTGVGNQKRGAVVHNVSNNRTYLVYGDPSEYINGSYSGQASNVSAGEAQSLDQLIERGYAWAIGHTEQEIRDIANSVFITNNANQKANCINFARGNNVVYTGRGQTFQNTSNKTWIVTVGPKNVTCRHYVIYVSTTATGTKTQFDTMAIINPGEWFTWGAYPETIGTNEQEATVRRMEINNLCVPEEVYSKAEVDALIKNSGSSGIKVVSFNNLTTGTQSGFTSTKISNASWRLSWTYSKVHLMWEIQYNSVDGGGNSYTGSQSYTTSSLVYIFAYNNLNKQINYSGWTPWWYRSHIYALVED